MSGAKLDRREFLAAGSMLTGALMMDAGRGASAGVTKSSAASAHKGSAFDGTAKWIGRDNPAKPACFGQQARAPLTWTCL